MNTSRVEKYVNEAGEVAVLCSPGYGAGWSTWVPEHYKNFMLFDKRLVELVIAYKRHKIPALVESLFPGEYVCTLGHDQLEIEWMVPGSAFLVEEYDGSESITLMDKIEYFVA